MPVLASSFWTAGIGPRPMTSGRIAATVEATIRTFGVNPSSAAFSSLITNSAAAPSLSGQELPAVTEPPSLNTGFNAASPSIVVPGRGPSSLVTTVSGTSISLPSLSTSLCAGTVTGTISESKCPDSTAATARVWEMSAHSSWASRLTLRSSATFSAVMPIGM